MIRVSSHGNINHGASVIAEEKHSRRCSSSPSSTRGAPPLLPCRRELLDLTEPATRVRGRPARECSGR
eukprot:447326-Prymnesium_polylepis.1